MGGFKKELKRNKSWRKTEIKTANCRWNCEIADIPYKMYDTPAEDASKTWRVVAMRMPTEETLRTMGDFEELERREIIKEKLKKIYKKKALKEAGKTYHDRHWKNIDGYLYKFFITNDYERSSEEIVHEFNKRGNAERKFSFLKKDFGWNLPPFMNMNENTVFMILAALANNVFRASVSLFKDKIPQLRSNATLGEFIKEFIEVSCEYVNGFYEFYNTDIAYEKIM